MELVNTWVFGNHGLSTDYIQLKTQLLSQMYCRPCCYQLRNVIIYIADHYSLFSVCVTHYSSNADVCTPSWSSSCTGLASTFNYYVIIRPPDIIIIQNGGEKWVCAMQDYTWRGSREEVLSVFT